MTTLWIVGALPTQQVEVRAADVKECFRMLARAFDFQAYTPIERWAEGKLDLTHKVTPYPGRLNLDRFPYQRGALAAWSCTRYTELWLVWGAQNGKTLLIQIVMAYIIDQDPGPVMIVYPDMSTAKRRSRKHLQPFITGAPVLARHMTGNPDDMQNYEFALDTCVINLGWAGSASILSAEPIRYAIGDEVAKWRHLDKSEAHPLDLFLRRTIAYGEMARKLLATTPKMEGNPGWSQLEDSTWHEYFVPCPHCGKPDDLADLPILVTEQSQEQLADRLKAAGYQKLIFQQFTGWDKERDPEKVAELAFYKCIHCGGEIHHAHKLDMLRAGKWIPRDPTRARAGLHLPSWYSPRVKFGEVAARFVSALHEPEKLRDWVNHDAAELWREMGMQKSTDDIRQHCAAYPPDVLPFVPLAVTLSVDVQQDEFYYTIVAWGEHEQHALIRWGMLPRLGRPKEGTDGEDPSFRVLDDVRARTFADRTGKAWGIDFCGMDSGYDAPAVYDYCRRHPGCIPLKGEDGQKVPLQYSRPETIMTGSGKKAAAPDSVYLVTYSSPYFRDLVAGRLAVQIDEPGALWLPHAVDDEFVFQMTGDMKVKKTNKAGRPSFIWKTVHRNHYWDITVGQYVLARAIGVRDMTPRAQGQPPAGGGSEPIKQGGRTTGSSWVTMGR
jgi:phage terminase large subunit GpA-like protein